MTDPLPGTGTLVAGRYELRAALGRGGMGVVYKAHDQLLDEPVALKILTVAPEPDPDYEARFQSEIKLARRVSHWNVCRIHDYGEDGTLRYISMELIEGRDLRRCLRESGPFAGPDAFDVALQIADGLQAIHRVGIIHRDLKAQNVMRDNSGVVKVMDFGIAKDSTRVLGATATGHVLGTPEYMSPEQAQGGGVDVRSDVYALGILLFELFTGEVPFRGDTPIATILKQIHEPAPLEGARAERLPGVMRPILRRALAKDPGERYPNAEELAIGVRSARSDFLRATAEAAAEHVAASTQPAGGAPLNNAVTTAATTATEAAKRTSRLRSRKHGVPALVGIVGVVGVGLALRYGLFRPEASGPLESPAASASPPTVNPPPTTSRPPSRTLHPPPAVIGPGNGTDTGDARPVSPKLDIGTKLRVDIVEELRSDRLQKGQQFDAVLVEAAIRGTEVVVPAGAPIKGRVEYAGPTSLEISLIGIVLGDRLIQVRTDIVRLAASSGGARSQSRAVVIGAAAGAALGGVVGSVVRGKKGAATGAVAGGVAGAALAKSSEVADNTRRFGNRLTFRLAQPLLLQ